MTPLRRTSVLARLRKMARARPVSLERAASLSVQAVGTNTKMRWSLPPLQTMGELAEWLRLSGAQLDWLADRQHRNRRQPSGALQHYSYRWVPKRSGGFRLIEMPKSRLKCIQRQILEDILAAIPTHRAAHGFRKRRSILSYAQPHAGRCLVLRMDLNHFFNSISAARVNGILREGGYTSEVASTLSALCTNTVPRKVLENCPEIGTAYARGLALVELERPHLPQGAPTSPTLANLCAYRLDCRLEGLARVAEASYTRYADDLLFSGDESFTRSARRFVTQVAAICLDEGFSPHLRKTRIMRASSRQHAVGIVLNEKLNVRRADFDELKAILCNCLRHGPQSQNLRRHHDFRAHLAGRIAHLSAVNPLRGAKLKSRFEQIQW